MKYVENEIYKGEREREDQKQCNFRNIISKTPEKFFTIYTNY